MRLGRFFNPPARPFVSSMENSGHNPIAWFQGFNTIEKIRTAIRQVNIPPGVPNIIPIGIQPEHSQLAPTPQVHFPVTNNTVGAMNVNNMHAQNVFSNLRAPTGVPTTPIVNILPGIRKVTGG